MTQEEMHNTLLPRLKSEGQVYKKIKNIFAKKAQGGERIETNTSDGLETINTALSGDYIIRNQTGAQEMYVIGGAKFAQKYAWLKSGKDGFDEYRPLGQIIALEVSEALLRDLNWPPKFQFTAAWGEAMQVREGDFLASPLDMKEVYRIARKEFFETYGPLDDQK